MQTQPILPVTQIQRSEKYTDKDADFNLAGPTIGGCSYILSIGSITTNCLPKWIPITLGFCSLSVNLLALCYETLTFPSKDVNEIKQKPYRFWFVCGCACNLIGTALAVTSIVLAFKWHPC